MGQKKKVDSPLWTILFSTTVPATKVFMMKRVTQKKRQNQSQSVPIVTLSTKETKTKPIPITSFEPTNSNERMKSEVKWQRLVLLTRKILPMKLQNPISQIATPNCRASSSPPMPLVLNVVKISSMTMVAYRRLPMQTKWMSSNENPKLYLHNHITTHIKINFNQKKDIIQVE